MASALENLRLERIRNTAGVVAAGFATEIIGTGALAAAGLINEFVALGLISVESVGMIIAVIRCLSAGSTRLDNAVDKYGESVLDEMRGISQRVGRKY